MLPLILLNPAGLSFSKHAMYYVKRQGSVDCSGNIQQRGEWVIVRGATSAVVL